MINAVGDYIDNVPFELIFMIPALGFTYYNVELLTNVYYND